MVPDTEVSPALWGTQENKNYIYLPVLISMVPKGK